MNLHEVNTPKMGSNLGRRLGFIYFRFSLFGNTYVLMDKSKQRKKTLRLNIQIYIYIIIFFSVSFSTACKLVVSIVYKLPDIFVSYSGKNLPLENISRYSSQFDVHSHNMPI